MLFFQQAHTLYNSVAVRQPYDEEIWSQKAFKIQQNYWDGCANISYEKQKEITNGLRKRLEDIRQICREDILKAKQLADEYEHDNQDPTLDYEFYVSVKNISLSCSKMMQDLAGEVISHSVNSLINEPPCDFNAVALGSLARGEATPYSDLEYLFLIENRTATSVQYFEKLAVTSYFFIGNLGETKLSHMAIKELKGWFDDRAKIGFQIDSLSSGAGNIPTGNGIGAKCNHFIVTPAELASCYKHVLDNPDEHEALRGDLTAMLKYTKSFYSRQSSNADLLDDFRERLVSVTPNQHRKDINLKMLKADMEKGMFSFGELPSCRGFNYDVKSELYRRPSMILLDWSIIEGVATESSWEVLEKLTCSQQELCIDFRFTLAAAVYLRLSTYLHHNSQDERISVAMSVDPTSTISARTTRESMRWFSPLGLFSVLVAKSVSICISNDKTHDLEQGDFRTILKITDWMPELISQLYCARHFQALSTLKKVFGDELLDDPLSSQHHQPKLVTQYVALTLFLCNKAKPALALLHSIHGQGKNDCRGVMATCLSNLGMHIDAINILQTLLEDREKMDDQCDGAQDSFNFDLSYIYLHLGAVYLKMGDDKNAERYLVLAMQMELNSASREAETDYHGYSVEADDPCDNFLNIERMSPEERLNMIKHPTNDILFILEGLAEIYFDHKRPHLALACSEKLENLIQTYYGEEAVVSLAAENFILRAKINTELHKHEAAIKYYNKSADILQKLGCDSAKLTLIMIYKSLASSYLCDDEFEVAESCIHKALPLLNKNDDQDEPSCLVIGDVYNSLAAHSIEQHDLERARNHLFKALRSCKQVSKADGQSVLHGVATILQNLGFISFSTGQDEQAKRYYTHALARFNQLEDLNELTKLLNTIGLIYQRNGEYYKAQESCERAILICELNQLDTKHTANMVCTLGLSYWLQGWNSKACDAFSKSLNMLLKVDPGSPLVNDIQKYFAIKPGPVLFST